MSDLSIQGIGRSDSSVTTDGNGSRRLATRDHHRDPARFPRHGGLQH